MPSKNTGGPAFPFMPPVTNDCTVGPAPGFPQPHNGMSLRDKFAESALIGLLSDSSRQGSRQELAESCYGIADAMLAEREK